MASYPKCNSVEFAGRREGPNGNVCNTLTNELHKALTHFERGFRYLPPEARPTLLPQGSVFLIAELVGGMHETDTDEGHDHEGVAGCLALILHPPDSPAVCGLPQTARIGVIKRVFVRPAHQRKGVAGMLLEGAVKVAKLDHSVDLLVLETLTVTHEAQKIYEAYG